MKDILAKLCETLHNPLTRDEMCQHMQALFHEFPLAKDEKELERPCSGTPNSLSLQQEENDEGISMMHASLDDINRDMARAKLYKEKTMSSDSEMPFQPRWAHRSPRLRRKQQPTHYPRHQIAKWGTRVGRMQMRRQRLFSPASPSSMLPPHVPVPLLQGEENPSSSIRGKGSMTLMHPARTSSTASHVVMIESKRGKAITPQHPKTQSEKPKSSKGKRYKGKYRLSQEMMSQYLKESQYFRCGEFGHVSRTCIPKKQKEDSDKDTRPRRYF